MTEYKPKSEFLRTIIERGFFHQCTDLEALDARLMADAPVSAYIGFDATADSLHVGSLIQLMMLRWFQASGHKPIILVGGGTTKVGDPSGKDESRKLLDKKTISSNMHGIHAAIYGYIIFEDGLSDDTGKKLGAIQTDNAKWLDELNYVEFLRDIGRHFTINRMITMDSVKTRLDREQPLTFLEFNYMLLQSYDYLQLHQRHGCVLQMGGSDQWGNIVNGIDLIRRVDGTQAFGLTSPLLTKADGSKMGKTASGAIWLDSNKTSPYDFWQFWRNTLDEDVEKFLKLFTQLPLEECERLGALQGQDLNEAKIILANEACALCHGWEESQRAEVDGMTVREANDIRVLARMDERRRDITQLGLSNDIEFRIAELLVKTGLASSGKEAKSMIFNGEVLLNDKPVSENTEIKLTDYMIRDGEIPADNTDEDLIKLNVGKKKFILIDFSKHPALIKYRESINT